jgi:transposase InsO family protein
MLTIVESVKREAGTSYASICRELDVPRSSLMRWRSHEQSGEAVVGRPGPAKTEPLDLHALHEKILALAHGRKRTHGTGEFYQQHRDQISRRDLQDMVKATRRELQQEAEALERRIEWLVPGAVWSMDDTKKPWLEQGYGHLHVVMDLGSRCALRTLGSEALADGEHVAGSLEDLFHRHGAPLFLKMDGGGNFRHHVVRERLGEFGVIPLVSPPHYPPYNGSVEREHQVLLRQINLHLGGETISEKDLRLECELCGYEINHKRRRSLGDRTACFTLEQGRSLVTRYGRREREEVFEEIRALAVDIAAGLDEHTLAAAETAFRYAAETWMQENNVIRVTRNGEVLPLFYRFRSH